MCGVCCVRVAARVLCVVERGRGEVCCLFVLSVFVRALLSREATVNRISRCLLVVASFVGFPARFWWVLGIRPDGQESQQEVPQGPSGALGPAGGLADVFQRQPDGAGSARWTRIDSGQWSVYGNR